MVKRKSKSPRRVDRIRKPRKVKLDDSVLGGLLEDYRQDPSEAIKKYRKGQKEEE